MHLSRQNSTPGKKMQCWQYPITGRIYKQDNLTLYNIILCNIADTSDEFTYVNPYINKEYGRTDIKALRIRYENIAI